MGSPPSLHEQLEEDVTTHYRTVCGDFFPGGTYRLVRVNDVWSVILVDYQEGIAAAFVDVSGPDRSGGSGDMVGVTYALMTVVPRLQTEQSPVVRTIDSSSDFSSDPEPWMVDWVKSNA